MYIKNLIPVILKAMGSATHLISGYLATQKNLMFTTRLEATRTLSTEGVCSQSPG